MKKNPELFGLRNHGAALQPRNADLLSSLLPGFLTGSGSPLGGLFGGGSSGMSSNPFSGMTDMMSQMMQMQMQMQMFNGMMQMMQNSPMMGGGGFGGGGGGGGLAGSVLQRSPLLASSKDYTAAASTVNGLTFTSPNPTQGELKALQAAIGAAFNAQAVDTGQQAQNVLLGALIANPGGSQSTALALLLSQA